MTTTRFGPWTLLAIVVAVAIGGCATLGRTVTTDPRDATPSASPAGERRDAPSSVQTP